MGESTSRVERTHPAAPGVSSSDVENPLAAPILPAGMHAPFTSRDARALLLTLLSGALALGCTARGAAEPRVTARAADGVGRVEAIPGGLLAESALDLWRLPNAVAELAAPAELREVPGAELVVAGVGAWTRLPRSSRLAWVDGRELRTLDAAGGGPPRVVDLSGIPGRPLRATAAAGGASFLLEMARPLLVEHEEVQAVLLDQGRALEPSPPIRAREGFDVHWVPGAARFALSSFERGTVWTWAPGAAQPEPVFQASPADPLAETAAGPGEAELTLLVENEATGRFQSIVLRLAVGARPSSPVALPEGVWEACRWSPDGSRLACLRTVQRRKRASVVTRDGRIAAEWSPPEGEDLASLAWADDGPRLWLGTGAALRTWRPEGL